MKKNEIVARFVGLPITRSVVEFSGNRETVEQTIKWKFDQDYNMLMSAWVKFRDLKFDKIHMMNLHKSRITIIANKIVFGTITEAFDELVKGIEWYNSLNKTT